MRNRQTAELAALPFRHAFMRLDDSGFFTGPAHAAAAHLHYAFQEACSSCGIAEREDEMPSYNMIATRRWMMVVPRVQETCDLGSERLQVSALWFAGMAFATRPEQIALIEQAGPMRLLASVTNTDI